MKSVRAFRGATQLLADDKLEMRGAVVELLQDIWLEVVRRKCVFRISSFKAIAGIRW